MSSQETINTLCKHTRWDPATPDKLSFFIFAFSDPLQLAEALPAHCFVEIPGTTALLRCFLERNLTPKWWSGFSCCLALLDSTAFMKSLAASSLTS